MKRKFPDRPQTPHLLKVIQPSGNAFILKGDNIAWNNPWHFHPEIELLYCIRGKGTNYVGNYIHAIEEGEILLFGKNLPHTRQRNKEYYAAYPEDEPQTIVVQFREEFLGDKIFSLKEFSFIGSLLSKAQRGLRFTGRTRERIAARLEQLKNVNGLTAILELLGILDELGRSEDFTFLNPVYYLSDLNNHDTLKINRVLAFVHDNFRHPVTLSAVAEMAHLSPTAFCRYFKTRTRRSFMEYLTQIRIDYACVLLMKGDMDVTQVCFASGFNNLSHFNKQFKKIMQVTPGVYRQKALRKIPVA